MLLSGPAGAGKSERARQILADANVPTVMFDLQTFYASLLGIERLPDGRYPQRAVEDAHALGVAEYLRRAAITGATQEGIEVVTTNSDGDPTRRQQLLALLGANAVEEIIDPGIAVVTERLSVDGVLSEQCTAAISRWYQMREERLVEVRAEADTLHAVLLQEGRQASGGRSESFAPGSIEWPSEGILVRPAHLAATDVRAVPQRGDKGRISITAALTPALRSAWDSGRHYMSVEFHALEQRVVKGGAREVLRALVVAGALVEKPEYDVAVAEVREEEQIPKRKLVLLP